MNAKPIKIAVTALVLTLGFAGLLYSTLRDGTEYYKHVDEVMTNPPAWQGKRLQLHGFIVDGSILQKPDTLQYRFKVQNNGQIVQAEYTGIVPDGFKSGSEVVLKGMLTPQHGFSVEPGGVMAKCPSKYVAGPPVPGAKS
jgi:cytochrome c-type biogenesis protein CcmE